MRIGSDIIVARSRAVLWFHANRKCAFFGVLPSLAPRTENGVFSFTGEDNVNGYHVTVFDPSLERVTDAPQLPAVASRTFQSTVLLRSVNLSWIGAVTFRSCVHVTSPSDGLCAVHDPRLRVPFLRQPQRTFIVPCSRQCVRIVASSTAARAMRSGSRFRFLSRAASYGTATAEARGDDVR